jgi:hypothetical protein
MAGGNLMGTNSSFSPFGFAGLPAPGALLAGLPALFLTVMIRNLRHTKNNLNPPSPFLIFVLH